MRRVIRSRALDHAIGFIVGASVATLLCFLAECLEHLL